MGRLRAFCPPRHHGQRRSSAGECLTALLCHECSGVSTTGFSFSDALRMMCGPRRPLSSGRCNRSCGCCPRNTKQHYYQWGQRPWFRHESAMWGREGGLNNQTTKPCGRVMNGADACFLNRRTRYQVPCGWPRLFLLKAASLAVAIARV